MRLSRLVVLTVLILPLSMGSECKRKALAVESTSCGAWCSDLDCAGAEDCYEGVCACHGCTSYYDALDEGAVAPSCESDTGEPIL